MFLELKKLFLGCLWSKLLAKCILEYVCWLLACLTSQQHTSAPQGRICSDNFTCCHTETEVADQTFFLTQSQYTDTGPTSPSADPIMPGAQQGSHWSANFVITGITRPGKIPAQARIEPQVCRSRGGRTNHQAKEAVVFQRRICFRQLYMLPHGVKSCRSNLLSHPVTVYRFLANQS